MKRSKEFYCDGVGRYTIVKRSGVRSIRITVKHLEGVVVTAPYFVSWSSAAQFVEKKRGWIVEALKKQEQRRVQNSIIVQNGGRVKLINGAVQFSFIEKRSSSLPKKGYRVGIEGEGEYIFTVEVTKEIEALHNAFYEALKVASGLYLPKRVEELSKLHNLYPKEVKVRRSSGRWGSCSSSGNISLNSHLIRLPAELCDYIILHELAHLKHPNHGPKFHTLLNQICGGNSKELRKELTKFSPKLELSIAAVEGL